jgi:heme-degrading monooxygenase HmoA
LVTQDVNDPESLYTITFWDDMASVEAWEASSEYENVFVAAIRPFIVGSQSVSLCEVKVENISGLVSSTKGDTASQPFAIQREIDRS